MARSRLYYRTRQFVGALRPRVDAADYVLVENLLERSLVPLFYGMSRRDQRHALDVCQLLLRAGCRHTDLLAAALLHDVGKGRPWLWQRVAYVVLTAAVPSLVDWLACSPCPAFAWLHRLHSHEVRAAAMIEAAGGSEALRRLVGGSAATPAENFRLLLLRAADDAC